MNQVSPESAGSGAEGGASPDTGEGETPMFTLVVHGTFAREEWWWRPGIANAEISAALGPSFADNLELALSRCGMPETVWTPALRHGMTVGEFAWSGENLDPARCQGARKLAASFDELAARMKCTAARPLQLNIIAHSHGGNVALEALKRVGERVRVRRLILLGTPLIEYRRSLRLLRAALAMFVAAAMMIAFALWLLVAIDWLSGTLGVFEEGDLRFFLFFGVILFLVSSWVFVVLAGLVDRLWRALCEPIDRLRGRRNQAYGPSAKALHKLMGDKKVLLITSHHDEADLMLRLGSRPRQLFDQVVRKQWPRVVQWIELLLLRPFIDWLAFHMLEAVLEHYVLGFSWLRCWMSDFRLADLDNSRAYPKSIFNRHDVTDELRTGAARVPSLIAPLLEEPSAREQRARRSEGKDRHMAVLFDNLQQVGQSLSNQIRLLHSRYYEDAAIVRIIAQALTGVDPGVVGRGDASTSIAGDAGPARDASRERAKIVT